MRGPAAHVDKGEVSERDNIMRAGGSVSHLQMHASEGQTGDGVSEQLWGRAGGGVQEGEDQVGTQQLPWAWAKAAVHQPLPLRDAMLGDEAEEVLPGVSRRGVARVLVVVAVVVVSLLVHVRQRSGPRGRGGTYICPCP